MTLVLATATQIAIYDSAFNRLKADIVLSYQQGEVPQLYLRHRTVALALGVHELTILQTTVIEMTKAVRAAEAALTPDTTAEQAHAAISCIRLAAKGWGLEDYLIDMSFSLYGLRLLEATLT